MAVTLRYVTEFGKLALQKTIWCAKTECTPTTLDASQRTVTASGQLNDMSSERQVNVKQHTKITDTMRRLCGSAGRWEWCIRWWLACRTPKNIGTRNWQDLPSSDGDIVCTSRDSTGAYSIDHDDKTEHRQHKNEMKVHVFRNHGDISNIQNKHAATVHRTDPWGTPCNTGQLDDCLSRMRMDWCLSDRYETNQCKALPLTPYDRSSHCKSILWSTVSNAAVISRTASTERLAELESSAPMRSE